MCIHGTPSIQCLLKRNSGQFSPEWKSGLFGGCCFQQPCSSSSTAAFFGKDTKAARRLHVQCNIELLFLLLLVAPFGLCIYMSYIVQKSLCRFSAFFLSPNSTSAVFCWWLSAVHTDVFMASRLLIMRHFLFYWNQISPLGIQIAIFDGMVQCVE